MTSSSISTPDALTNAIRELTRNDPDADLSAAGHAIEQAEAARRARIETALKGIADLEKLKGCAVRRFVLVYWMNNKTHIAQGVVYPPEYDRDGKPISDSVFVHDRGLYLPASYATMRHLHESWGERKIPYALAYYDE